MDCFDIINVTAIASGVAPPKGYECEKPKKIAENTWEDRRLSSHLYIADPEVRIQQEIILGIGGVRVLRALGVNPSVWHANEGHIAFMNLERIREFMERRVPYEEARRYVEATTVFTTHTPVPAGHDVFPNDLIEKYFRNFWSSMGLDKEKFLCLGRQDGHNDDKFNMTVLSLKMAQHRNGVSELHGAVSRRMWQGLWPKLPEDEVPITHITNGVHAPTWIAPDMDNLYQKYLDADWWKRQEDAEMWKRVLDIPNDELWEARQLMKRKLLSIIYDQVQKGWENGSLAPEQVPAMGALLNQGVLTIGFVRRFASYKRPALIFRDIERLKKIINDPWRPVQIVFAGKSHPADLPGKELLHHVYSLGTDREFGGRIAFVEDFNMFTARYLVHGIDVWLNVPRRLQEASGTSGMKAALNGVPHLSVLDGWWSEAYNGANGWAIGREEPFDDTETEDCSDAESLYRLLEEEIIPLFYNRTRDNVPHGWLHVVKEAISTVGPMFSAKRMMTEYVERMYIPAAEAARSHRPRPATSKPSRSHKREPSIVR
jgi:starch phosphorylase